MKDYLLFRLYGAMASWGDIAVGEYRPSFSHPGKSSIIGLLSLALGIKRSEEEKIASLAGSCRYAVMVDAPGSPLTDYHTIQIPPKRKGAVHYSRKDELSSESLGTILSSREYRCDALYTVVIWISGKEPFSLEMIKEGLLKPRFTPYLGRKSCPLAISMEPKVLRGDTVISAIKKAGYGDYNGLLKSLMKGDRKTLHSEEPDTAGIKLPFEIVRRDSVLSRARWQFADRAEYWGDVPKEEGL